MTWTEVEKACCVFSYAKTGSFKQLSNLFKNKFTTPQVRIRKTPTKSRIQAWTKTFKEVGSVENKLRVIPRVRPARSP